MKWLWNLILSLFGGSSSAKKRKRLADRNKPMLVLGVDYGAYDLNPTDYCNACVEAGGHAVGVEFGGLMNKNGQHKGVTDGVAHYRSRMKGNVAIAKAAKKANLYAKFVFWNTNANAGPTTNASELCKVLDEFRVALGDAISNVILVPMSEDDNNGKFLRSAVINRANQTWDHNQLVRMTGDSRPWLWQETHVQHKDFSADHHEHFFYVTDSMPTIEDVCSVDDVRRMAQKARNAMTSFHLYSLYTTKIPKDKWKAAGDVYAGVNE